MILDGELGSNTISIRVFELPKVWGKGRRSDSRGEDRVVREVSDGMYSDTKEHWLSLPSSQLQPKLQRRENLGLFYPKFNCFNFIFPFYSWREAGTYILGWKTICKSQFSLSTSRDQTQVLSAKYLYLLSSLTSSTPKSHRSSADQLPKCTNCIF